MTLATMQAVRVAGELVPRPVRLIDQRGVWALTKSRSGDAADGRYNVTHEPTGLAVLFGDLRTCRAAMERLGRSFAHFGRDLNFGDKADPASDEARRVAQLVRVLGGPICSACWPRSLADVPTEHRRGCRRASAAGAGS